MATTIQTGWSAGTSNFDGIFSNSGASKYYSLPISTINSVLNNAGIPTNAQITEVTLTATASFETSSLGEYKLSIGYGSNGSISTYLIQGETIASVSMGASLTKTVNLSIGSAFSPFGISTANGSYITFRIYSENYGSKTYSIKNVYLTVTYSIPTYTLTVTAGTGGTVTGGGPYNNQATATLIAIPNSGYKFKQWSDGNTSATRTVTVTGNATYTAVFEPIYVSYDTILSYRKWKNEGIVAYGGVISNITDAGFTLTSNSDALEATAASPYFPVEPGKSYKIDIEFSGNNWDVYIFFCDTNGNWVDFADGPTNRYSSNGSTGISKDNAIFTAPNKSEVVKAQIRVDSNGANNTVSFSNFRIYPADCPYMSNSVPASERTDQTSWSMPTPTREGYNFKGWNTKPDGSGTTYTSSSTFPTADLVLYSQWEEAPPEIKAVSMTYMDKQISETNKVPVGEGFIITVELG